MFQRFTDHARQCIALAEDEARRLGHSHVGTEHILLGLIREGDSVAAKALESLGVSLAAARGQVEITGQGQQTPSGHTPFSSRAKEVLELSLREALQLGHNYIGPEHLLLGLIREGEGRAMQVLAALGADLATVRQQVFHLLAGTAQVESGHPTDIPAGHAVRNVAELAQQVAEARDLARKLWAHLPADVKKKLSEDSPSSIPPWVRDQHGT